MEKKGKLSNYVPWWLKSATIGSLLFSAIRHWKVEKVEKVFELTASESSPLCSGSRGFSSVICCSFMPAILDSNLQSPWQQRTEIYTHTHT